MVTAALAAADGSVALVAHELHQGERNLLGDRHLITLGRAARTGPLAVQLPVRVFAVQVTETVTLLVPSTKPNWAAAALPSQSKSPGSDGAACASDRALVQRSRKALQSPAAFSARRVGSGTNRRDSIANPIAPTSGTIRSAVIAAMLPRRSPTSPNNARSKATPKRCDPLFSSKASAAKRAAPGSWIMLDQISRDGYSDPLIPK